MKNRRTLIASLLLAAGLSGIAVAQGNPGGMPGGPGCDGAGPGRMAQRVGMQADPAQRVERHLAMLKYQLNITDAQAPAWQAYEQKMKEEAGQGWKAMRTQIDEKLTAPERMAKMQGLMEARVAAMRGVHDSFKQLYAALTSAQQQKADEFAAQMPLGQSGKAARGAGMGPRGGAPM